MIREKIYIRDMREIAKRSIGRQPIKNLEKNE